jgi:hypothetical protein
MAYEFVAEAYDMPADILYAVAMTESAKSHGEIHRPWPWALNINGVGVYCATQQEATLILKAAIREHRSVDIGLMQISWRWHQHRFSHSAEALIPLHNLRAGAAILREQYERDEDWWQAVGRYHSPGNDMASQAKARTYRQRVEQHWQALNL